ncbi:MAG TPA: hypothetical protein VEX18_03375 [Polyangiaceae bacterium]|nr:hypothetical protein [Polyangiaceae bacterium]
MSRLVSFASPLLAFGLVGCPTGPSDPPPPASKPEIPQAPPRAVGALAAGTDAAPRPERTPGVQMLPNLPHGGGKLSAPGTAGGAGPGPGSEGLAPAEPDAGMAL